MKKTFKKFMSVLLAATMLLSIAPLSGLSDFNLFTTASAADIVETGKCGENVTYTLDSYGNLTISGTGPMYDFDVGSSPFYGNDDIKNITIENGVTRIGDSAFCGCTFLTSITIPDSVTIIEEHAFHYCICLANIEIPNSVKIIGDSAFYNCEALTSIDIPTGVENIGTWAFWECSALENIVIPDSVTNIGDGAFDFCSKLTNITVSPNNKHYSSDENGVLYNKDKTELIQYPIGNERTSFTIPDEVTSIGECAFLDCYALESIIIPNSVTNIGDGAFQCCNALESITIPEGVTNIKERTFSSTIVLPTDASELIEDYSHLTTVALPSTITKIDDTSFENSTKIKAVYLNGDSLDYSTEAFDHLKNLTVFGEGKNGKKLADKNKDWKFVSIEYKKSSKTLNFNGNFDIYSDVDYSFLDQHFSSNHNIKYCYFEKLVFPEIETAKVKDSITGKLASKMDKDAEYLTFEKITLKLPDDEYVPKITEEDVANENFGGLIDELEDTYESNPQTSKIREFFEGFERVCENVLRSCANFIKKLRDKIFK